MNNPESIKDRIQRLRIEIKKLQLDYRRALLDSQQWKYGNRGNEKIQCREEKGHVNNQARRSAL